MKVIYTPEERAVLKQAEEIKRRARERLKAGLAPALRVKPKQGRITDTAHLAFVRRLPCTVCCAEGGVDAAHIRFGDLARDKPPAGMGMKPDDKWVLPMCRECHRTQHQQNERAFWAKCGIDALELAECLYECTGDEAKARALIAAL